MSELVDVMEPTRTHRNRVVRYCGHAFGVGQAQGRLAISIGKKAKQYTLMEFAPGEGWDGRAFWLRPWLGGLADSAYSVFMDANPEQPLTRCDCMGFEKSGTCKHIDAIQVCLDNQWLDVDRGPVGLDHGLELRLCPLCESPAIVQELVPGRSWQAVCQGVGCGVAVGPRETPEEVVERWNRRPEGSQS
jgi:hypothetical protein